MKAKRRKTTGTGRMRHLKEVSRKFKNGFRLVPISSLCLDFLLNMFDFVERVPPPPRRSRPPLNKRIVIETSVPTAAGSLDRRQCSIEGSYGCNDSCLVLCGACLYWHTLFFANLPICLRSGTRLQTMLLGSPRQEFAQLFALRHIVVEPYDYYTVDSP